MVNRVISNPLPQFERAATLAPPSVGAPQTQFDFLMEGVVVDVVVNDEHPDFSVDGYNVGCVRFRDYKSHFYRATDQLHWAFPLDDHFEDYPLKNEIVLVFQALNRLYYSKKVNLGNKPVHQAFPGLESEMGAPATDSDRLRQAQQSVYAPRNTTSQINTQLGSYFKDISGVYRLRHWEGDRVFEGRSGQSIRFGTSWLDQKIHKGVFQSTTSDQAPTILLRVGPNSLTRPIPNTLYGRVTEDINDDKSSIWMSSDMVVPLVPSTKSNTTIHGKSVRNYPSQFDGNQIVLNTDRFVLNTKLERIFFHSGAGIHSTTLGDSTLDVSQDVISYVGRNRPTEIIGNQIENVGLNNLIWVGETNSNKTVRDWLNFVGRDSAIHSGRRIALISPKIYIGSETSTASTEPMVLGTQLVNILQRFIDAHLNNAANHVTTAVGPGVLSPGIVSALSSLKSDLNKILSSDNFVNKTNTTPTAPGTRVPIHSR